MSIYDITFSDEWNKLIPPSKRSKEFLDWGKALLKPLQWLRDLFFVDYVLGNTSAQYDNTATYLKGERVQYNHQVYEAQATTTGNLPTDVNFWMLVQADFRGTNQRIGFNAQLLKFEFILNQWFGTTFVQPVYNPPSANSDIWIENEFVDDGSFVMGPSDGIGSFMGPSGFNDHFMSPSHSFNTTDFIVHYPIAVIPNSSDQLNQLMSLVNQYKLAGTTPSYQSY